VLTKPAAPQKAAGLFLQIFSKSAIFIARFSRRFSIEIWEARTVRWAVRQRTMDRCEQ